MKKIIYQNNKWLEVIPVNITGYEEYLLTTVTEDENLKSQIEALRTRIEQQSNIDLDPITENSLVELLKTELDRETLNSITIIKAILMFDAEHSNLMGTLFYSETIDDEVKNTQKDFVFKPVNI
jgi:hypothetical protein